MTVNRRVYKVKRYTSRRSTFSPGHFNGRKIFLFVGIAAAVVVVVVLFATGVFTGLLAKDTTAQVQASSEATAMPSASPSATPTPSASPSASASPSPSVSASAARVLSLTDPHMQGDDVKALQEKLGITADGSFGPSTKAALIAFQEENGLPADGIAGPDTLAKLGL